jgi:predicted glycoside hydrolase/deacetylase ChbG (UPF0249 family)
LGICEERDTAIFNLFEKGLISSASILVNGINFKNALKKAKELNMPLGLHLNLTEGFPIYNKNPTKNSLLKIREINIEKVNENQIEYNLKENKNKFKEIYMDFYNDNTSNTHEIEGIFNYEFHGKFNFREKFKENQIKILDIKNEIISQIERFIFFNKEIPINLDGHQHIHIIPELAEIISEIMSDYFGIYRIRIPKENQKFFKSLNFSVEYTKEKLDFHKKIMSDSLISEEIYAKRNIFSTGNFFGMTLTGKNMSIENIKKAIEITKENIQSKIF